jgi:Ala-tRNA(Pro) deacylase
MSVHELGKIKSTLALLGLHPTYLEHEEVITSEDAAKTRGFELKQGIKALFFTDGKENWVVVDAPANTKAGQKKIAAALGWSKGGTRMATPEEVIEITGCEIGSVPPFGHKKKIPILVDTQIFQNNESAFNIGLRTNSVKIQTAKMKIVFDDAGAILGAFAKQ